MNTITGGSAFPPGQYRKVTEQPVNRFYDKDMTLRDYFAAKALAALIGYENKDGDNRGKRAVPTLAKWSYEYADAMLEAREEGHDNQ